MLKQPQYEPMPAPEQIAILLAATMGILDDIPLDEIESAKKRSQERFQNGCLNCISEFYRLRSSSPRIMRMLLNMSRNILRK